MAESRQFLVRVTSSSASASASSSDLELELDDDDDDELPSPRDAKRDCGKVMEYWWSLSRCKSGEFTGSYMVDAVIPNRL